MFSIPCPSPGNVYLYGISDDALKSQGTRK